MDMYVTKGTGVVIQIKLIIILVKEGNVNQCLLIETANATYIVTPVNRTGRNPVLCFQFCSP